MWILVLVLIQPFPLPTISATLLHCQSYRQCVERQAVVMADMVAAYPGEDDFRVQCRWQDAIRRTQ